MVHVTIVTESEGAIFTMQMSGKLVLISVRQKQQRLGLVTMRERDTLLLPLTNLRGTYAILSSNKLTSV